MRKVYEEDIYELKSKTISDKIIEYTDTFPSDQVDVTKNQVFTSHEGLLLNYEQCFLRKIDGKYYDLSSHFLWIGKIDQ